MAAARDLVLVDGSSYLFRAFHALPPLVNSRRRPTGAVKGVINMIRALLKAHPDRDTAIVFDAKGKTFRDEIYSEYKANRPPMPDELRGQIPPIHDIVRAMGLPLLIVGGVEADDVIGTLAERASAAGRRTLISTGDKDLAQLVDERVTLINTMNNETLDAEGVLGKFGVPPERIVDYLALVGDKSDNIPGVPGVGPKTAAKWLAEHGSMEGLIENAGAIAGKAGENLRGGLDLLRLSRRLATIKRDVALDFGVEDLGRGEEDLDALLGLFRELEFKTWIRELEKRGATGPSLLAPRKDPDRPRPDAPAEPAGKGGGAAPAKTRYVTVTTEKALAALAERLAGAERFGLSLESDGEHFLDAELFGVAASTAPGRAWYVPAGHEDGARQLPLERVLAALAPALGDARVIKAGHDLKSMRHVLRNHGIALEPLKSDVLLAAYVLDSVSVRRGLADIARRHLDLALAEPEAMRGRGRTPARRVPVADYARHACEKADFALRLSARLERKLTETPALLELYRRCELPLIEVLEAMEREGVLLDAKALKRQSGRLARRLEKLEERVFAEAGERFNMSSPKQLQAVLYEKLGLPVHRKTSTGQPSTAEPVLTALSEEFALPRLILEHRSLNKLKTTYADRLPEDIHPRTGRVHTSFRQAVAATGRLSSTDPNLQNIPIRTDEGRHVRRAFVAAPGRRLMAADYSQVELRIMAHLSRDAGLLEAFASDTDVHRVTAAEVFGAPLGKVTPEQRRSAKAINFGLIYGMSAFGLADQLHISRGEARRYMERYFERYPGVRRFMDDTRALADEKGYVETLFGRRLYLPDIRAGNAALKKAAQRTAINAPMQGTAADIIKLAMIDIDCWLAEAGLKARMLLQVHDELVFEVEEGDLAPLSDGVVFRMTTAAALDVPLVVHVGAADSWDQAR